MTHKFFQLAKSASVLLSSTVGFSILNAFSPVELLNLVYFNQVENHQALAVGPAERIYAEVSPAVVTIKSDSGFGSGSIIDADGLVLTNWHVVQDTQTLQVVLANGQTLTGIVVRYDAGLDLAIVQIQGGRNFPVVEMADADSIRPGQDVYAIGNPFGKFQNNISRGIISGLEPRRIVTDASINQGNSGGPLLNDRGELIGVVSSLYNEKDTVYIGIGLAVPVAQVQSFLANDSNSSGNPANNRPSDEEIQYIALNAGPTQGRLTANSLVLAADNSHFVPYLFEGEAGQQVVIQMNSSEIDPYLILTDGSKNIAEDDDSGGGNNARITVTLPANGTYTLLANAAPRNTGRYSLQITAADSTVAFLQEGILGSSSPVLQTDNSRYHDYSFEGAAGQSVTISLESSDFDTYLLLYDPDEQLIGENDDASTNTLNSSITITLPASGTYTIRANAYDSSGQGRYKLVVRSLVES